MKQFKRNNDHANSKNRLAEIIETSTKIIITFFFKESFNLWRPLLMITLYHQIKTPIITYIYIISFYINKIFCLIDYSYIEKKKLN